MLAARARVSASSATLLPIPSAAVQLEGGVRAIQIREVDIGGNVTACFFLVHEVRGFGLVRGSSRDCRTRRHKCEGWCVSCLADCLHPPRASIRPAPLLPSFPLLQDGSDEDVSYRKCLANLFADMQSLTQSAPSGARKSGGRGSGGRGGGRGGRGSPGRGGRGRGGRGRGRGRH